MYKRVWQKIFAILAENQLVQNTESLPEKKPYILAGTQLSVTASSAENQLSLTGLHCENLFLAFSQHKFSLIESLGDNLFSVAESYAFC